MLQRADVSTTFCSTKVEREGGEGGGEMHENSARITYFLITERESRIGRILPEVFLVRLIGDRRIRRGLA